MHGKWLTIKLLEQFSGFRVVPKMYFLKGKSKKEGFLKILLVQIYKFHSASKKKVILQLQL